MFNLKEFIKNYQPYDAIEAADKMSFEQFFDVFGDNIYTRNNLIGHVTVSAFVVNQKRDSVLMAYHLIYDSWAWLGGHADGDKNLLAAAAREAREEAGISNLRVLKDVPVDIDVGTVLFHLKKGKAVSAHLHYNLTYVFEADENEHLHLKADENAGVKWIKFENIEKECHKEPNYIKIYERIVNKIKEAKW